MALIVPDLGLLFIMAPHTGCTAIGTVLRERFGATFVPTDDILGPDGTIRVPRKHSRLPQLLEAGVVSHEQRSRLVVAAGVRNPFDEEVSHYTQREREHPARRDDAETRARLVGDKPPAELEDIDFETWLRRRYVARPWHGLLGRTPKRPADFTEGADVVIRFERLQADVNDLMARLGVAGPVEIPVVNRTAVRAERPYQEFYTPAARAIVERVFADRIARHGYRFEICPHLVGHPARTAARAHRDRVSRRDDPLARDHGPEVLLARARAAIAGRGHVDPDFIIVGAARAGTTGLLSQLRSHPGTLFCARQELHFFDVEHRWSEGPAAYRKLFPTQAAKAAAIAAGQGPALSGENSPYYLAHPLVPARVRATIPSVRLIALLRDPTERAISHWNWRLNRKQETRDLATIVEEELPALADVPAGGGADAWAGSDQWERRNRAYLARGLYLEQLQRWHAAVPREQLLVLISEQYYADPRPTLERVWRHVGLAPAPVTDGTRNARRTRQSLDPALVTRMRRFFAPHNAALEKYLGEPLGWD